MSTLYRINLKDLPFHSEDTRRIMEQTRYACERLNVYLQDFFETMSILSENREKYRKKNDLDKLRETSESMAFVESKIAEVTESMKLIAQDMSEFVELQEQTV